MGPARFHCATLLSCKGQPNIANIALLQHLTKKNLTWGPLLGWKIQKHYLWGRNFLKKTFVRSGIRTHAHRSGLRHERSALDLSAILGIMWLQWSVAKIKKKVHVLNVEKVSPRPGIEPGPSTWQAEILTTRLSRNHVLWDKRICMQFSRNRQAKVLQRANIA